MNLDLSSYFPTFRGLLRSADLNAAFKEFSSFLGVAIGLLQRLKRKDDAFRLGLAYDLQAVEEYVTALEGEQSTLDTAAKLLYRSFSNGTDLSTNGSDPPLVASPEHGILCLQEVQRTSFILEVEDEWGDAIPDPIVKIYVDDVLAPQTATARNIISRRPEDLWLVEGAGAGNRTVRIVFPRAPQVAPNYLLLAPLPIYKETISGVMFRDFNGDLAVPYADFPATVVQKKLFHFSNASFRDEARFVLTPWSTGGKYIYGMRTFDLGHISHAATGVVRFSMSNAEAITNIIGIAHTPVNGSFVQPGPAVIGYLDAEPVTIRIFSDSGFSNLLWDNTYPYPSAAAPISAGGGTTIYIEIEMTKVSDTTPILKELSVVYTS